MEWDKKSNWIWVNSKQSADTYGEFYSEFYYDGGETTFYISADSNYVLFLNGTFVNSGQYPDFPRYKIYDALDITRYCRQGMNKIGIIVWYYGVENMSYACGNAALKFEVRNRSELIAYSNETVLSRLSRTYKNGLKKIITKQLGFSFLYDAAAEDGWLTGELNCFKKSRAIHQSLPLFPRAIQKLSIKERCPSKMIKKTKKRYLFDLQQEEVGYLTFKVWSDKKQTLTICYGEHINDGEVRRIIGGRDFSVQVVVPQGVTEYTNYFRRLWLRYLEVFAEAELDIEYVSVLPCEYPLKTVKKNFENELHQKIYDISVRTLQLCMHDHYEDCPWREQALYTMDSRNQMLCGYYAFHEYEFPRANLYLMSKDNRSDRLLSICTPTTANLTIPSFSLHYITQVYEYTVYSGDLTLAKAVLPKLKSILSVFTERMELGLVQNFTEKHHWNFYEWTDGLSGNLGVASEKSADAALNCFVSIAFANMQKICELLKINSDYHILAEQLNNNIRKAFYDQDRGLYINVAGRNETSELVNSLAVLCGAARGKEADQICKFLASDNSMTKISLSMMCFKFDALLKMDKEKYSDTVIKTIEQKYKAMIDKGATSFWETEEGEADFGNAGSLCHGWSAMPVYYLNKIVC